MADDNNTDTEQTTHETAARVTAPTAPARGEVQISKNKKADLLGQEGQTFEERADDARAEAAANHKQEHAEDDPKQAKQDGRL